MVLPGSLSPEVKVRARRSKGCRVALTSWLCNLNLGHFTS